MRTVWMSVTAVVAVVAFVACSDDSGNTVTIKLPRAPSAIVAYRDGSAPWTATTGADGDVTFAAPSGAYSVAIACNLEGERQVRAYELTTAELSTVDYEVECGAAMQTISGTFTNVSALGAVVFWGPQTFSGGEQSYSFSAPRRTGDLVATPYNGGGNRIVVKRGLTLANEPLFVDIDFNEPAALELTTHRVGADIPGDEVTVSTSLLTGGGTFTSVPLCSSALPMTCGVSSSQLAPDDLHVVRAQVIDRSKGRIRSARWTTRDVVDRVLNLPKAAPSTPTVSAVTELGRASVVVQWPTAPRVPLYRVIAYQDVQPPAQTIWELFVSEGRAPNGLDVALPDLAGVTGWDTTFDLVAGQNVITWWAETRDGATIDEMMRRFPQREGLVLTDAWVGVVQSP